MRGRPAAATAWLLAVALWAAALACSSSTTTPNSPAVPTPANPGDATAAVTVPGLAGRALLTRANELVVRDMATGDERTIASADGADYIKDPTWSPDGSRAAYSLQITLDPGEGSDYGSDLYLVDADGANVRLLQQHDKPGTFFVSPSFSPDGNTLYFFSARQDDASGSINPVFELQSMDLASDEVTVIADEAYGGEVSNDGSTIAFIDLSAGKQQLTLIDVASGERRVLVTPDDGLSFMYAPRFSPDDRHIVLAGSGDIGLVPTVANPARPTAGDEGLLDGVAAWLFGGDALADGPPWDLYLVDTSGQPNLRRLTEVFDDQPFPAWSADGDHLLYIGITGLVYLDVARRDEPVVLDEGLLHAQLDWVE